MLRAVQIDGRINGFAGKPAGGGKRPGGDPSAGSNCSSTLLSCQSRSKANRIA